MEENKIGILEMALYKDHLQKEKLSGKKWFIYSTNFIELWWSCNIQPQKYKKSSKQEATDDEFALKRLYKK